MLNNIIKYAVAHREHVKEFFQWVGVSIIGVLLFVLLVTTICK